MSIQGVFKPIEQRLFFQFSARREDGPLRWAYATHTAIRADHSDCEEPTPLCESLMKEAMERGAFSGEDLDKEAERLAGAALTLLDRGTSEESQGREGLSDRQKESLDRWLPLIAAEAAEESGKKTADLEPLRAEAERQLRGKASVLSMALRISEDPAKTREAIERGLGKSRCPWKMALAGLLPEGLDPMRITGAGEPERRSVWESWGAALAKALGRIRDQDSKAEAAIEGLSGLGLGGLFGKLGEGRSIFESGVARGAIARRWALEMGLKKPAELARELSDKQAFASVFFLTKKDLPPSDGDLAHLRDFLAAAKKAGALPDPLPKLEAGDVWDLGKVIGSPKRPLAALELLDLYEEEGRGGKVWEEASAEEMAKAKSAEGIELSLRLGGKSRIPEAAKAWAERVEAGEVFGPASEMFPSALSEAGAGDLLEDGERLRLWVRVLKAGNAEAALSLSFSPPAGSDPSSLLEVAEGVRELARGKLGQERAKLDEPRAKMLDALAESPAFRDALAATRGRKGMGHFSAFCGEYARVSTKLGGSEKAKREAAIEALRVAARSGSEKESPRPEARARKAL